MFGALSQWATLFQHCKYRAFIFILQDNKSHLVNQTVPSIRFIISFTDSSVRSPFFRKMRIFGGIMRNWVFIIPL